MRMWRYGSRGSNVPRPTRPSPTPFSRTSSEGDRLPSEEKLAERISGLRDQAVEQEARQFGAFANTARNSPQTVNCVVGLAGLEPPTRPLWRDAPAPRTPQWDIFDGPGHVHATLGTVLRWRRRVRSRTTPAGPWCANVNLTLGLASWPLAAYSQAEATASYE